MIKSFLQQFLTTIQPTDKLRFVTNSEWQKLRVASANPLTFPNTFDNRDHQIMVRGCRIVRSDSECGATTRTLNSVVDIVTPQYHLEVVEADGAYYVIRDNTVYLHRLSAYQAMQYLATVGNHS